MASAEAPAQEFICYFDSAVNNKFKANTLNEIYETLNSYFERKLEKLNINASDPTWNLRFFKREDEKLYITHCIHYFCTENRVWTKVTKFANASKKCFRTSVEVEEEPFPTEIPFFFNDNINETLYAKSMEDLQNAYQSHMFLNMPEYGSEHEYTTALFHGLTMGDKTMSNWSMTFFSPFERKWVKITRCLGYRVRNPSHPIPKDL